MNATVDDLVATIGEQTIEIRLLKKQVLEFQQSSNLKDQEIIKLSVELDIFKEKKDNKKEK